MNFTLCRVTDNHKSTTKKVVEDAIRAWSASKAVCQLDFQSAHLKSRNYLTLRRCAIQEWAVPIVSGLEPGKWYVLSSSYLHVLVSPQLELCVWETPCHHRCPCKDKGRTLSPENWKFQWTWSLHVMKQGPLSCNEAFPLQTRPCSYNQQHLCEPSDLRYSKLFRWARVVQKQKINEKWTSHSHRVLAPSETGLSR